MLIKIYYRTMVKLYDMELSGLRHMMVSAVFKYFRTVKLIAEYVLNS